MHLTNKIERIFLLISREDEGERKGTLGNHAEANKTNLEKSQVKSQTRNMPKRYKHFIKE